MLLSLFVVLAIPACTPQPDEPDLPVHPAQPTKTARPPLITKTKTALPPKPTRVLPTLTSAAPAALATQTPKPGAALPDGEVVGTYDLNEKGGLGVIQYAFATDYGYQLVFYSGGGIIWYNDQEAGFEATFSTPFDYLAGNNISTRTSDYSIVVAEYYPMESGNVVLWEVFNGISQKVKELNEPALIVTSLEFSPDGNLLAVGYNNGEIRLFDTDDGALRDSILAHHDNVTSLKFSYDNRYLVSESWSFDPFTYVFDVTSGSQVAVLATESYEPGVISFSTDGTLVSATSSDGTHIFTTSGWQDTGMTVPGVWEGRFTCDGQMLMLSYGDAVTNFYSIADGQEVGTVEHAPLYCLHRFMMKDLSYENVWQLLYLEVDQTRNVVNLVSYTP
jgi:hypothetical protein